MSGVGAEDDDYLEDYYDAIVLSTGLGSSIIAAALAKAGKSVLYLDCHEHYGQDTATFSFTQLLDWAEENGGTSSSRRATANPVNGNGSSAEAPSGNRSPATTASPFDRDAAGIAIARAHVRHERKKEREAGAGAGAGAGAEAASAATVKEEKAELRPSGGGSSNESDAGGAGKLELEAQGAHTTKEKREKQDRGEEQGSRSAAEQGGNATADAATLGCPAPSQGISIGSSSNSGQQHRPNGEEDEDEDEDGKGSTTAEEGEGQVDGAEIAEEKESAAEKAIEQAETEARLRSLDLHLLPLSYHGCRTRAGAPSDACVSERRARKAAEEAAAASGRFLGGRQPRPSHPSWAGRREPCKVAKRECSPGAVGEEGQDGAEAAGVALTGTSGVEEAMHPSFWGYRTDQRPNAEDLVRLSRSFNLDLTSQVLLATGTAVDALVDSGIASYLEFKDMQALYLASDLAPAGKGGGGGSGAGGARGGRRTDQRGGSENGGSNRGSGNASETPTTTPTAPATESNSNPGVNLGLSRVPCSKADVFGTKLLTPLEKRRLMKFLLFASDWGLQRAGEDVLGRNEAGLGKGRSLRRPQNREVASGDFGAEAYAGKPFAEFLRSCGLPARVRAMITHALALLPGEVDPDGGEGAGGAAAGRGLGEGGLVMTEEGLEAVYRHLSALGRFGETAFITPLYGVGELSQSFCRMAAVHGAICMLRRQLRGAVVDRVTGRCVGVVDDAGRAFGCANLVVGGEFFTAHPAAAATAVSSSTSPARATEMEQDHHHEKTNQSPPLSAAAPSDPSPPPPPPLPSSSSCQPLPPSKKESLLERPRRRRLLRRIVLASGPVAPEGRGRGLCVLPPGLESVGNPAAVHVVSLDESTAACPGNLDGACVIHLTTTMTTTSTITEEEEEEEEEAFAAGGSREGGGEMVAAEAAGDGGVLPATTAEAACEAAGAEEAAATAGAEDENGSEGVLARAAKALIAAAGVEEIWSLGFSWDIQDPPRIEDLPPNMVVSERLGQELYVHDVVVQAERAFARLCPGRPFWPPPAANEEDDDDQAELLRAAASAVSEKVEGKDDAVEEGEPRQPAGEDREEGHGGSDGQGKDKEGGGGSRTKLGKQKTEKNEGQHGR